MLNAINNIIQKLSKSGINSLKSTIRMMMIIGKFTITVIMIIIMITIKINLTLTLSANIGESLLKKEK